MDQKKMTVVCGLGQSFLHASTIDMTEAMTAAEFDERMRRRRLIDAENNNCPCCFDPQTGVCAPNLLKYTELALAALAVTAILCVLALTSTPSFGCYKCPTVANHSICNQNGTVHADFNKSSMIQIQLVEDMTMTHDPSDDGSVTLTDLTNPNPNSVDLAILPETADFAIPPAENVNRPTQTSDEPAATKPRFI